VKSGWYLRDVFVFIFGNTTGFGGATLMSFAFTAAVDFTGGAALTGAGFTSVFFTSTFFGIGFCTGFFTATGFFNTGLTTFLPGAAFLAAFLTAGFLALDAAGLAFATGLAAFLGAGLEDFFAGAGFLAAALTGLDGFFCCWFSSFLFSCHVNFLFL